MDRSKAVSSGGKNEMRNGSKRSKQLIVEDNEKGLADINKMAEDFIKNFRNQLKILGEEPFKRFREMLGRGTWIFHIYIYIAVLL